MSWSRARPGCAVVLQRDVAVLCHDPGAFDAFDAVGHPPVRHEALEGAECSFHGLPGAGVHVVPRAWLSIEVGALVGRRVGAGVIADRGVAGRRVDGPTGTVIADRGVALDRRLRDADRLSVRLLLDLARGARGAAVCVVGAADVGSTSAAGGPSGGGIGPPTSGNHRRRTPQNQGDGEQVRLAHVAPPPRTGV